MSLVDKRRLPEQVSTDMWNMRAIPQNACDMPHLSCMHSKSSTCILNSIKEECILNSLKEGKLNPYSCIYYYSLLKNNVERSESELGLRVHPWLTSVSWQWNISTLLTYMDRSSWSIIALHKFHNIHKRTNYQRNEGDYSNRGARVSILSIQWRGIHLF